MLLYSLLYICKRHKGRGFKFNLSFKTNFLKKFDACKPVLLDWILAAQYTPAADWLSPSVPQVLIGQLMATLFFYGSCCSFSQMFL
jgi:hypothetical protein